jgi:hypothetical protein
MQMTRCLCVISSKNPTSVLSETILGVKTHYPEFDIVVVDSDSTDFSGYKRIPQIMSVECCKNKNWELGAWHYALSKFDDYDIYMFIQDTLTPIRRIPGFDVVNFPPTLFYSCHYNALVSDGGYFDNLVNVYANTNLSFISDLPPNAPMLGAAHSSFITCRQVAKQILKLEDAYIEKKLLKTKIDSWLSERTVGIMADRIGTQRIDVCNHFQKTNGRRDLEGEYALYLNRT